MTCISHSTTLSVKTNYEERRSHFISTYHFSIFPFPSIKPSLHYEHTIIEKEMGLHFSSASIAAPISACWILLNKTQVRCTFIQRVSSKTNGMATKYSGWFSCLVHKLLSDYLSRHILNCTDRHMHKGMQKCHLFAQSLFKLFVPHL